ncbi:hypothetical protein [Citrobacter freundii]|uniref:hypothetical protein n=1 Tax=Citrobacter freundii TaxID=546 RepID=UPI00070D19B6|nr:hypothetical protein [Citrobacter freundii]
MSVRKTVELVAISAITTVVIAMVAVLGIYYFHLNAVMTLTVTLFLVSVYFVFAVSNAEERSARNFAARKALMSQCDMHDLMWFDLDSDTRMRWFEKVGENAPSSETKLKYQRIQEAIRYWDKDHNRLS